MGNRTMLTALSGAAFFLASALTIGTFFPIPWGCGAFALGGAVAGALGWRKGGLILGPLIAGALLYEDWIAYAIMAFLAYTPVLLYDDARALLENKKRDSGPGERPHTDE